MSSHAVLEIQLSSLTHNYHFIKSKLHAQTKLLAVVKANGYGSESVSVAKKLEELGIDYLAVAYVVEGVKLRAAGIKTPILVLHPQLGDFKDIIHQCLEPSIYSLRSLEAFIKTAQDLDCEAYPIHLKTNTGLNRLGVTERDFPSVFSSLKAQKAVSPKGLMSHLAASDDLLEREFTERQIKTFSNHIQLFEAELGPIPLKHLLNTSGILNFPQAQFNMARSGIGLYGYSNNPDIDKQLKPVATLKANVSQIHELQVGDWVGYNKGFVANKPMRIGTISLGHADGISRQYGQGKGVVSVGGGLAPIVGNVCMDMLMVELGDLQVQEGDMAVIFGEGAGQIASAEDFASGAKTISYELLTAISARVQRQIIE